MVLVMFCITGLPAGESLAAAGVDALRQRVMQTGINHIQTDGLLVNLTAGIPVQHTHNQKTH